MSDKSYVLELPEDLIARASAAKLDLRQLLIDALESKLPGEDTEIAHILNQRLPADQVGTALQAVRNGERILGLHAGLIEVSDKFDEPLPDDFWLGSDL